MTLCRVEFFGESIGRQTGMKVLLPDGGRGPFPVLYLLHGYSGDYSIWHRRTRIEWYVRDMPLIVVMPDGATSFYANSGQCGAYEDHIVKDVVGLIERTFPAARKRSARAVAGLSMGGYGAMMLGLKHAEKFSVVSSHSGVFRPGRWIGAKAEMLPLLRTLGRKEYDCHSLATAFKASGRRTAIRLDCGIDDDLLNSSRRFHKHLDKIGLSHEYHEYPGDHDWDYWEAHLVETLDFVMKHVRK